MLSEEWEARQDREFRGKRRAAGRVASRGWLGFVNFSLGLIAGCVLAVIGTVTAARHPEIGPKLGFAVVSTRQPSTLAAKLEPACPPVTAAPRIGTTEMLFTKRRFWTVTP